MIHLQMKLEQRTQQGNLRALPSIDTDSLIDFSSNDYLGFARSKELGEEIVEEWLRHGKNHRLYTGASGSRLLTGNSAFAEMVEQEISRFHAAEAGLLYASGYCANIGLLSAVVQRYDTVFFDKEIHASSRDGLTLTRARCISFKHNDVSDLDELLKRCTGRSFVCIESIYSIDGSIAPLREICDVCRHYGSSLIVDEAHATGTVGTWGQGLVQLLGCEQSVFARVHSFGKALGVQGAIVLGSHLLRDFLINFSRPFIYTTGLSPLFLASIRCAYLKLQRSQQLIQQLQALRINGSSIHPIFLERVQEASDWLRTRGFDVRAIKPPSVPKGKECLRLVLHAYNSHQQIDELFKQVEAING